MTLIINGATGKKLSKRDETVLQFIEQYRELGYLPEAMFNFITLLGWSPVGEDEIFTKKEFIKQFDPKRLSKSPARFDQKKLEWVNNQYIKAKQKTNPNELMSMSLANLIEDGLIHSDPDPKTIEWARQLISLYTDQMSYTAQISKLADIFFDKATDLTDDERKELADDNAKPVIEHSLKKSEHWTPSTRIPLAALSTKSSKKPRLKAASCTCRSALPQRCGCMAHNWLKRLSSWGAIRC